MGRYDPEHVLNTYQLKLVVLDVFKINKADYRALLESFYAVELLAYTRAYKAEDKIVKKYPYLKNGFYMCSQAEQGHMEIALKDMGGIDKDTSMVAIMINPTFKEYDEFLDNYFNRAPHSVLGFAYVFEHVSANIFPEVPSFPYPRHFIDVHAQEDPTHSAQIRRTVEHLAHTLYDEQKMEILDVAQKSSDYYLKLIRSI